MSIDPQTQPPFIKILPREVRNFIYLDLWSSGRLVLEEVLTACHKPRQSLFLSAELGIRMSRDGHVIIQTGTIPLFSYQTPIYEDL